MSPFIKAIAMRRILAAGRPGPVEVITRFDLLCFYDGVSDIEAIQLLLEAGARIRGVKNLHAKLFVFSSAIAICTSANVTDAGMLRNHEFGFVSDDREVVSSCQSYFDGLWNRAGADLVHEKLGEWCSDVATARRTYGGAGRPALPDYGVRIENHTPFAPTVKGSSGYGNQAFLKFFGRGGRRTPRTIAIAEIVADSGCNWACTYPSRRRPRQVEDGDVLYMARIVEPKDILIYGCAVGWRHRDDEDVATEADIAAQPWKTEYANYIRVHDGRFVDAVLNVGISMYEMLRQLGHDSWRSTQDHARSGSGNTDARAAYKRKAAMQLTDTSRAWIDDRLEALFRRYGEVDLSLPRFRPPG